MTICITGPESTGKSSLAKALSEKLSLPWVPEFARDYLEEHGPAYKYTDLLKIAHGQMQRQGEYAEKHPNQPLLLDTDLLTIYIWSTFKYGKVDAGLYRHFSKQKPDLYLLCDIDLPWESDVLREHPHARESLMKIYENEVKKTQLPYQKISGNGEERIHKALKFLKKMI